MKSTTAVVAALSLALGCGGSARTGDAAGSFAFSIEPAEVTLSPGGTAAAAVRVDRAVGYAGSVSVTVDGLPPGVTADPLTVATTETTGKLVLHARADAVAVSKVMLTAVASGEGGLVRTADFAATVLGPASFTIAGPGVVSVSAGGSAVVHVERGGTFFGAVVVSLKGLPAGVSAAAVEIAARDTSADLVVQAAASAEAGSFAVAIAGSGGGAEVRFPLELRVVAAGEARIGSFEPASGLVFVGEHTQLTAVFTGGGATIDGIGAVQSGTPVDTPPLSRDTTFVLRLATSGGEIDARLTVRAAYRNRFRVLADAPVGRGAHFAAALPGGGAVLAGGHGSDGLNVPDSDSSEIFDGASERTAIGPTLSFTVLWPDTAATQLLDGTMLFVGAAINNPALGAGAHRATMTFKADDPRFLRSGDMQVARISAGTVVVPLADGGALVPGGGGGLVPVGSAERYDVAARTWSPAADLVEPRMAHSATLLKDGRVLLSGGLQCCVAIPGGISQFFTATAEVYDPVANTFTATGSMATARGFHQATLLPDGRVLVTGGMGNAPDIAPTAAEIWNPASGEFAPAGELAAPRLDHGAVLLTDGRVLVAGGTDPRTQTDGIAVTEIYDPAAGWTQGPSLAPAWAYSTVTLLDSGKVLVFGGETAGEDPVATVLLFE